MRQGNKKRNTRVCVLVRGQEYEAPKVEGTACTSRIHGHISYERAAQLVADGMAEWVKIERQGRTGRVYHRTVNAIRLVLRRRWAGRPSRDERGTVKTLQLVP